MTVPGDGSRSALDRHEDEIGRLRAELGLSETQVNDLRDLYFPGWARLARRAPDTRPFYSIRVDSDEVRRSILAATPPGVDVAVSASSPELEPLR